jgi:hypothetical protein
VKGTGDQIDYGQRVYDPRGGRFLSVDPLTSKYPELTPYQYASNSPIANKDLDGLEKIFFMAGAGNDNQGWNYVNRFKNIWTNVGITGFTRVDASHGKIGDMLFVDNFRNKDNMVIVSGHGPGGIISVQNDEMLKKSVDDIVTNITKEPLKEGQQLNLAGYSYGAVMQEYVALDLVKKGYTVSNLILIASPTEDESPLMKELEEKVKSGKIQNIIRYNIPGDNLSDPKNSLQYMYGVWQNRKDQGHHFDLARPDDPSTPNKDEGKETDDKIKAVGKWLKQKGVQ